MNGDKAATILLVEDEENLHEALKLNLELEGYAVTSAFDGVQALDAIKNEYFDLVILDIMLPEMDGIAVAETIRLSNTEIPILMLSAKNTSNDKVLGLKKGADDYLTKPFDTDELLARVRVALRNRLTRDGGNLAVTVADIHLDLVSRTVTKAGVEVHLTPKEYTVLAQLAHFPGRVITHKQIMNAVWPHEHDHHIEYLRVLIRSLRQKLETNPQQPQIICNELGIGYRLRGAT